MSKKSQREDSAFTAGREFYKSLRNSGVTTRSLGPYKKKQLEKIDKKVRTFWLKGWDAGAKGKVSNKVAKRKVKLSMLKK